MFISLFIKGLIIGFSIAAPVGPIGVLCINRSLHDGWKSGLAVGTGAAIADGIYGIIAGFGLTFISSFLINHQWWIQLIGGLFLVYLGAKTLRTKAPKQLTITSAKKNLLRTFSATFFLTLTNPMTIISFAAVFAGLGLGSTHASYRDASSMVLGIVLGSLLWWVLLTSVVAFFLKHINRSKLSWINVVSGLIILLFGIVALMRLYN